MACFKIEHSQVNNQYSQNLIVEVLFFCLKIVHFVVINTFAKTW